MSSSETTITARALRPGVVTGFLGVTLAAWAIVVARMRGMDAGPGTDLGSFGWYLGIWVTMMAAMMLPSATPMVLLFSKVSEQSSRRPGLATGAVRHGLPDRVDGIRPRCVRPVPACARARPRLPRLGPSRTGGHRSGDRAGRRLPADAVQARVPASLPHAAELRHASLARTARSAPCGWGSSTAPGASGAAGR